MKKAGLIDIVAKLREIEKIMAQVVEMWEHVDDQTHDLLARVYPFAQSFDEMHADLASWIETIEKEIEWRKEMV